VDWRRTRLGLSDRLAVTQQVGAAERFLEAGKGLRGGDWPSVARQGELGRNDAEERGERCD